MVKKPHNPSYLRRVNRDGKSWQCRIMIAPDPKQAGQRLHVALKTRDLTIAEQKRDDLIRKLHQRGLLTQTIQAKAKRAGIL